MFKGIKTASAFLILAFACNPAIWSQETPSAEPAQAPVSASSGQTHISISSGSSNISSFLKSPELYYRLDFRVLEVSAEGKVVNSRSYSEIVATGAKSVLRSSIRIGDRVPVVTDSAGQIQYMDVGTNIDAEKVEIVNQTLRLHAVAEISTLSSPASAPSNHPIIRTTRWDSNVIVPIDKPSVIFSSENYADKGKTELELTAIPIDK